MKNFEIDIMFKWNTVYIIMIMFNWWCYTELMIGNDQIMVVYNFNVKIKEDYGTIQMINIRVSLKH